MIKIAQPSHFLLLQVDSLADELSRLKSAGSSPITQPAAPTNSTKPVTFPAPQKRHVHDDDEEEDEDEEVEDEDEEEEEEDEEEEDEDAEEAHEEEEEEEEYDEEHEEDEEEDEEDDDSHHDKRSRRKTKRRDDSLGEVEEVEVKRESHEVKDPSPEEHGPRSGVGPRTFGATVEMPSVQRPWEIATDLDERSSKYARVEEEEERDPGAGEVERRSPTFYKKVFKKVSVGLL